jgi:hypothetical protein
MSWSTAAGCAPPGGARSPLGGPSQATRWNASAQSIPTPSTMPPLQDHQQVEARRRADGPVLTGRHPCGRRASRAVPLGRRLTSVLKGQASQAFPGGDPMSKEGNAISFDSALSDVQPACRLPAADRPAVHPSGRSIAHGQPDWVAQPGQPATSCWNPSAVWPIWKWASLVPASSSTHTAWRSDAQSILQNMPPPRGASDMSVKRALSRAVTDWHCLARPSAAGHRPSGGWRWCHRALSGRPILAVTPASPIPYDEDHASLHQGRVRQ